MVMQAMRRRFTHHICESLIKHPQYSKIFCPHCSKDPQLLECVNFFSLYMVPQGYIVDKPKLTARYKSYQSILHPDILKSKGIDNQDYSKLLQDGYRTLFDDVARAKYLLSLYNQDPDSITITDTDFLELMLEKRHGLDHSPQGDIIKLLNSVKGDIEKIKVLLKNYFDVFDWENAKDYTARLSFLIKLQEEAKNKLDHL